jgi:glutaminyl-tRNA synthetase
VPFTREIYIEQDDFMENPPHKFFRLAPGQEVRLKGAFIIKCQSVKKDDSGRITEVYCTYDPETRSGGPQADRKIKSTLHWVSAKYALNAEVRLYDRLFNDEDPSGHKDIDAREFLNPDSLTILNNCKVEPSLVDARPLDRFQFQRLGYFCVDYDSEKGNLVFNRTVPLKDTWQKINK